MTKTKTTLIRALTIIASLAAVLVPAAAAQASATKTRLASVKSNGQEVNVDNDFGSSVSADGRFVAFPSQGKYTGGDAGSDYDVFVHDRLTGKTRRASLKSNGKEVNGQDCLGHSISGNGNLVAFSCAGAMVGSDHNNSYDIYVKNMSSGKIVRASVKSNGSGVAGASSALASISANGRYVAFVSDGALVASDTNGDEDVYRHDRKTGKTIRISLRSNGDQSDQNANDPSISGDGNRVAFTTDDGSMTPDTDYSNGGGDATSSYAT